MRMQTFDTMLRAFAFQGQPESVQELTSGNINTTYVVRFATETGERVAYVLQMINTKVFKDPEALMKNICLVTEHLAKHLDEDTCCLTFVPTKDGTYIYRDEQGTAWRAYVFVEGTTAHDQIEDPQMFYEAGRGFGKFQCMLADFSADKLTETLPDFHNTPKRYEALMTAVRQDLAGRAASVSREVAFFEARRELVGRIVALMDSGVLPLRVTHNDTKLNNVLIDDKTGKARCVIDLDTVMPGTVLYDYGDAIRYGASTAAEDEPELAKIDADMELFRRFTDGFVSATDRHLTADEIRLLPLGALVITCEQGMRFLTDYINGDTYFKTRYEGHNLVRTHAQMKLLEAFEAHADEMNEYVKKLIK